MKAEGDIAIDVLKRILTDSFGPSFTPLHNDPRWAVFLVRVGT